MTKMLRQIMLVFVILLAGGAWGIRSVKLSDLTADTSHEGNLPKTHEHTDLLQMEHDEKTQKPSMILPVKNDKPMLFGESSHPYKDFDFNEVIESFFKPFINIFEPNKKPKVKTVVSITEVKHPMMQPFHPEQQLSSQFGVKELGLMDDPFGLDIGKMMSGFVTKLSTKHGHEKHTDTTNNLTDFDFFPPPFHRFPKNIFHRFDTPDEKIHNGPSFFIKGSAEEPPLVSLGEIKLDEVVNTNEDNKDRMCSLIKALPYMEGAIGGVMFVMLILVIASWRIRKPNGIWTRVPFVDKSQYIEKV